MRWTKKQNGFICILVSLDSERENVCVDLVVGRPIATTRKTRQEEEEVFLKNNDDDVYLPANWYNHLHHTVVQLASHHLDGVL